MSNGAMECDSCCAVLRHDIGGDYYCPNPECTGVFAKEDVVNKPSHYSLFGNIEVIDAIKELLTEEEFRGYLKGNVLKYRLRAGKKDNVEQDIAKAMRYEAWLSD